ncbi:hypothetical protein EIP86_009970 [Pleurotus ostreatoroseus]|nr:hypothetical protein EIP86_009970 [Pleurotus ostreatoroseus]
MTPFQAAGAAQAIEDVFVLAGLLGHPSTTRDTVARALKAYEYVRLPTANHVGQVSRDMGRIYELDPAYGKILDELADGMERLFDWVGGPDAPAELERAVRWCYPDDATALV